MCLIFLILAAVILIIGLLLRQALAPSDSTRKDPPGLGPAQLLPPTVHWRRPYWVSTAITEANGMMYMGLGLLGMFITLSFAVVLILRGSGDSFFGTIGLLLLVFQGGLFIKGMLDWQKDRALTSRGQLVQGVLIDRWVRHGRSRIDCVAYYFEPLGHAGLVRAEMNPKAYRTLRIGDAVQVRYLPDQPQVCHLEM
jgi:hypothetical protein